jgi:hypothetical protein
MYSKKKECFESVKQEVQMNVAKPVFQLQRKDTYFF